MMLWAHDTNFPLARRSSENLKLREDEKGLWFEARLNNTSWANDAYEAIKNRDVQGMSFGFEVLQVLWRQEGEGDNAKFFRDLLEVKLWEISPVVWPAFDDTSVDARSILAAKFPKIFTPEPITKPDEVHSADHSEAEIEEKIRQESIQRNAKFREAQLRFLELKL